MTKPSVLVRSPTMVWVFAMVSDLAIWAIAVAVALALRLEFDFSEVSLAGSVFLFAMLAITNLGIGLSSQLYLQRFSPGSLEELKALGLSVSLTTLLVGSIFVAFGNQLGLPRSLTFIAAPVFLLLSGSLRVVHRELKNRARVLDSAALRAIIFGAGHAGEALIFQLLTDKESPFKPVALLDDSKVKANRSIRGVRVCGSWGDLSSVARKHRAQVVIVAIPSATSDLLQLVYRDATKSGLQVVVFPSLRDYLEGRNSPQELRDVSIEDLIGRRTVSLDSAQIFQLLKNRAVMVTGAGGSIGAELVAQVARFAPARISLVDRDETTLLTSSTSCARLAPEVPLETHLVDIRDSDAVLSLFTSAKPEVVFHAAALKHLPILERFPEEAWKTNVEGSLNVLRSARRTGVQAFVNISTDKAANPSNVLGRSKRLAEQLTAWFGHQTGLTYVSVRFGNVLGSRGSLVPILADQISNGGPVCLTDKEATRYFMSIPEACQLVLQAAAEGEGGDVLVLDMGEPVRIQDVAERMIEMSGRSVEIMYTGLRPGEKLHEDLLSDSEELLPSSHPKFMRLKATVKSPKEVLAEKW